MEREGVLIDAPLLDLPPGSAGRVSRVTSDDVEAIKYLDSVGIRGGAAIVLKTVAPFEGPVEVRVGGRVRHLGRRLAQMIHVTDRKKGREAAPVRAVRG